MPSNIAESTLFGGNVQFLRGPAGTTYGRNALAGAVNLVSRAPTPTFTAEAEGGYGRNNYNDVGLNVAGPLTSNLGYRVGIQRFEAPTIEHNLAGPEAGFAQRNLYIEFQLEWKYRGFHIRNRFTHFEYDNNPNYPSFSRYRSNLPDGSPAAVFDGLDPNPQYGLAGPAPSQPYQISVNYPGYDKLRGNIQDIVNADLDLGFGSLVYVGGYQKYVSTGSSDLDLTGRTSYPADTTAPGTFAPGTIVPTDYRANYENRDSFWSQELRLESKPGNRLDWAAGFYYYHQEFNEYYHENIANAGAVLTTPTAGGGPALAAPNPAMDTFEQRNIYNIRSQAVFGNVNYDVTPTLRFDGGLRYTWDQKDALTNFRYIFYYPPFFAGDFSPAIHSANPARDDRGLSGRAAIAWHPEPGTQLYASYARGYQASAFTLGQGLPFTPQQTAAGFNATNSHVDNIADSEHLDVYEVGGNYIFGRVRFDGSVFYQNFFNQQIPIFAQLATPGPNGTTIRSTYTSFVNAKRSEIYGLEAQLTWHPTTHSNIVASYTYLHPVFKDFCPTQAGQATCGAVDLTLPAASPLAGVPQNLSGNEIPRTPRNKATLYGYYGINLGDHVGYLYPGGSVAYQSGFYTQPFQTPTFHVDGRTVVGLTLTYRTPKENLDITGSVQNVFRKYYTDNGNVQIVGNTITNVTTYGQDQYWTVTARYRF